MFAIRHLLGNSAVCPPETTIVVGADHLAHRVAQCELDIRLGDLVVWCSVDLVHELRVIMVLVRSTVAQRVVGDAQLLREKPFGIFAIFEHNAEGRRTVIVAIGVHGVAAAIVVPAAGIIRPAGQFAGIGGIAGIRTVITGLLRTPSIGVVPVRLDRGVFGSVNDSPFPVFALFLKRQIEIILAVPHMLRIAIRIAVKPVLVQEQIGDVCTAFGRGEIDLPRHLIDTTRDLLISVLRFGRCLCQLTPVSCCRLYGTQQHQSNQSVPWP
ncbi:hypothetical protein LDX67_08305 [Bifidobacterium pseudolongum]|uniref:hypothetical protein n=1 Tax=Bifidobacterium pseudolongum TaxID=1694 RepID=UPI001CE15CE2|nr:hypothetical protein [Bifidobacterium pseudolongum]UBZ04671.1 hypothetical protein LDX67_08305 [Bifidobacterium pseudolongum]